MSRDTMRYYFLNVKTYIRMSNDRHPVSFLRHRERSLAHVVGGRMRMVRATLAVAELGENGVRAHWKTIAIA